MRYLAEFEFLAVCGRVLQVDVDVLVDLHIQVKIDNGWLNVNLGFLLRVTVHNLLDFSHRLI